MNTRGAVDEFALIDRYFRGLGSARADVVAGVGDDAALLRPAPGRELVLTTDTLVAGRHFPGDGFPAEALGHRALAANLSDIAAMGAEPAWALLSLTLPDIDEAWVAAFARGFDALARRTDTALVGGNISAGPLAVAVTLAGQVDRGTALRRSGARAGDLLAVTGRLGGGAAGLRALREGRAGNSAAVAAYARPEPRLAQGRALADLANAAIDISDGLLGDLGKLLAASGGLGAEIAAADIPLAPGAAVDEALGPSDDYELLVSLPASALDAALSACAPVGLSCIGRVSRVGGIKLDGLRVEATRHGYRHFT